MNVIVNGKLLLFNLLLDWKRIQTEKKGNEYSSGKAKKIRQSATTSEDSFPTLPWYTYFKERR